MEKSYPVLVKEIYQSGEGDWKLTSWGKEIEKSKTEDSNKLEMAQKIY